jgi:hypothetical protein
LNDEDVDKTKPAQSDDSPAVPSWIKSLGVIVGILATLFTLIGQQHQYNLELKDRDVQLEREHSKQIQADEAIQRDKLAQKEEDTKKAAEQKLTENLVLQDEGVKLQIAETELRQHQDDVKASEAAREFEAQAKERKDQALRDSDQDKEVFLLVEMLFAKGSSGETSSAEPILAQLSRYSQEPRYSRPLADAISARLLHAQSDTEVQMAFALFSEIGAPAWTSVVQANRGARTVFEATWTRLFWTYTASLLTTNTSSGRSSFQSQEDFLGLESVRLQVPRSYLIALLREEERESHGVFLSSQPSDEFVESVRGKAGPLKDLPLMEKQLGVGRAIISQSELAIENKIGQLAANSAVLDLRSCYLADIGLSLASYPEVLLAEAYLGEAPTPPPKAHFSNGSRDAVLTERVGRFILLGDMAGGPPAN